MAKAEIRVATADEVVLALREGLGKFLKDSQKSYGGAKWMQRVYELVMGNIRLGQRGKGQFFGSKPLFLAMLASVCPRIKMAQDNLLIGDAFKIYQKKNGERTSPFPGNYADFGLNVNGEPITNPFYALSLLSGLKKRGASEREIAEGFVPAYSQMRVVPDQTEGLALRLSDGFGKSDLRRVKDFPFGLNSVGRDGVFRACLSADGDWYAVDVYLAGSYGNGRVACFGASAKKVSLVDGLVGRI
jgi:hypothetical protein